LFTKEDAPEKVAIGEKGIEESASELEHILSLGVIEFHAIKAQENDGVLYIGKALLKLPKNSQNREEIFQWSGGIANSMGFDAEVDEGQDYLFIAFD